MSLYRGGSLILYVSKEFSRKNDYKESILKPFDYYGQYKELED